MNHEIALEWLYTQLKRKRIALGWAEEKGNSREVDDIHRTIDILEWIIGAVLEKEDEDGNMFGKTVFLAKEEAEAAIAERSEEQC